jgi:hypothetical protein
MRFSLSNSSPMRTGIFRLWIEACACRRACSGVVVF